MSLSECPRSRSRATTRAWPTAAGVHSPPYRAIRPVWVQRLSVPGVTPTRVAASWRGTPCSVLDISQIVAQPNDLPPGKRVSALQSAAGLDPPACDRDGHVLLALEVPVGRLGAHRHLDLRLPGALVGPLPGQVGLVGSAGPDVDHHLDVGELEALRGVSLA